MSEEKHEEGEEYLREPTGETVKMRIMTWEGHQFEIKMDSCQSMYDAKCEAVSKLHIWKNAKEDGRWISFDECEGDMAILYGLPYNDRYNLICSYHFARINGRGTGNNPNSTKRVYSGLFYLQPEPEPVISFKSIGNAFGNVLGTLGSALKSLLDMEIHGYPQSITHTKPKLD